MNAIDVRGIQPGSEHPSQAAHARAHALATALVVGLAVVPVRPARADVLWEWNDAALGAAVAAKQLPFVQTRTMALLDVAMFDAVNAVDRRYASYALREDPARGASGEAAAAAAARAVPGPVQRLAGRRANQ